MNSGQENRRARQLCQLLRLQSRNLTNLAFHVCLRAFYVCLQSSRLDSAGLHQPTRDSVDTEEMQLSKKEASVTVFSRMPVMSFLRRFKNQRVALASVFSRTRMITQGCAQGTSSLGIRGSRFWTRTVPCKIRERYQCYPASGNSWE